MKYVASSSSAAISASITASALLTVFAAFGLAQRGGGRNTITASALLTVFAVFLGISLALGMAETNPVAFAQTLSDNYDLGPSNADATGITELNGKIYVVDSGDTKLFAYNADGTRDSASDVNLGSNNGNPAGITALHGKLLVVDNNDGKVYAYNPNDSRASSSDFNLDAANGNPNGITALHGNLWIVDNTANKVFVYNPDGTLVSSSEIGLSSDNGDSKGITALHGKLWVVDRTDNIVYVYNPDGTQDSSFEFALDAANASATGITTLHGKIWVVDNGGKKLYVYDDVPAPSAFSFRTDEDNSITSGITSLNGKFWVLDSGDDKVFAYNADGTRAATSFDFDLHSTNDSPFGITALNGKLWVADNAGEKVYAYNADGTRVSGSDFNLDTDNDSPAGITSFNGKFYVLDRTNSADKVYAYNADGTRAATSLDFSLPSANTSSFGITALYDKFYVVDLDGTVYAYNTADGSRAASSDFSLKKDSSPDGITSLHGKLWVVDGSTPATVYPYNPDGTRDLLLNINLDTDNGNPSGIASASTNGTLWVVDAVNTKVYAYNRTDGIVGSDFNFDLHSSNGAPTGITALVDKLYVLDETATKVYAYYATTGSRDSSSTIDLTTDNTAPTGITSSNNKFWIVDSTTGDYKVYAYNTADGSRAASSDFDLGVHTSSPQSITAHDGKLWIGDSNNIRVYNEADGSRVSSLDFDLNSENHSIDGITVSDDRFWVVDASDDKIYSYDVPTPDTTDTIDPTLSAVSISSDNTNDPSRATLGNTVTLDFTSSENIETPIVTIHGVASDAVTGSGDTWSATKTITSGDADGPVTFTIDFTDLAANDGTQVTSITTGSGVTVDQTAPTLIAVSIESNSLDTTLATAGNTVTLSFTSDEPILEPTVTISGDGASAIVTGSGISWSATKTVASTDDDGVVAFSISFTDLATNDGTPVTSPTTSNSDVTVDNTAPELTTVYIASDNADPSRATTDDTVTLEFTSSEPIQTPTVTFGGISAVVTGSATSWSAAKIITDTDSDGSAVTFTIDFTDWATNDGTPVTSTTDSSVVTVYQTAPDTTDPELNIVSIESNNSDTSRATLDDIITLSFTSDEPIGTPTVTINGITATVAPAVAGSTISWSATKAITAADNDGAVEFTIDFTDLATNDGIQVTSITTGSSVTVDQTAPELTAVSIESNNSNDTTLATAGNTVTLSFTSDEPILEPIVTINGDTVTATVLGGVTTTWSAETTIASTDSDGVVDFSISFFDLASNDGGIATSPTTSNPDVTVDNTAPELDTVSIESDNTDTNLATTDDTVTLEFTSLEPIQTPAVTFGGISADTVTGSGDTWSATKIITAADADGSAVTFDISFSDLATNAGTPVTSTTDSSVVTVYQTAPDTTDPELNIVSIESNNSDTSRATLDDIITLSFTSDEPIGTPTVTINGITATVAPAVAGSTISWSATKAITAADNDGAVEFTIDFTDLATNDGIQVTSITTGSSVTVDQTAPELTAVSIESNNSNDTTLATAGNTVTLSFTSDEPILEPIVTINGDTVTATVLGGVTTTWSAETTIASTDSDGVVDFSISFFDLASNDGGIATSPTTSNPDVTVDNTAPELDTVSIESDNTDTNLATTDDTVTLEFTSLEPIQTPAVTFGGISADTVTGSGDTWSATKIITAADADGSAVTFDISFSDLATNAGTPVTSTTDSSVVTVYQTAPDTTDPELNIVSIESNNSDTSRATLDDIITLSFTSDEPIGTPTVTINGITATVAPAVAGSTISWSATKAITAADNDGAVEFTIDFTDLATNDGIQVTSITTGSSVTVDQTAPELTAVSIESNNSNDTTLATAGNTVTLSFTSDEPILEPIVTINGDTVTATVLGGVTTTWSAETTIASTDSDGVVSISFFDLASNDGGIATSPTTSNPDVTVDNTAPELDTVSIESDNTDTNLLQLMILSH